MDQYANIDSRKFPRKWAGSEMKCPDFFRRIIEKHGPYRCLFNIQDGYWWVVFDRGEQILPGIPEERYLEAYRIEDPEGKPMAPATRHVSEFFLRRKQAENNGRAMNEAAQRRREKKLEVEEKRRENDKLENREKFRRATLDRHECMPAIQVGADLE